MADVESDDVVADSSLNVLAVADQDSLLSLEKVLEDCNHKVTKCKEAEECLTMLEDGKTKFHLVIIDVDLPTTDGYELCALIRKQSDVPIILISSTYTNVDTVQKAMSHGACDFLLKPIKVENLRKIDLHTLQNRALEKDARLVKKEWSCGEEEHEVSVPTTNDEQDVDNRVSIEKRKGDSITGLDPRSGKKARVIWTPELHQKFVEAVNSFGIEKAVPKKLLEMMNVPSLTRENVASHLQKFRQYHKRLQADSHPKLEKQPRRRQQQQQQKQEQHQSKSNEAMLDHEPNHHGFNTESQVLGDPTFQQPDLIQVPFYQHPTMHDTTLEALISLKTNPAYEALTVGLKMDQPTYEEWMDPATTEYVNTSNEFSQHAYQGVIHHLSNETSGYLHHQTALMPKIEPSYYDQSHYNQMEDIYGNLTHNPSMDPSHIQISPSQAMLTSVGHGIAALRVDHQLRQGGLPVDPTDQVNHITKDNEKAQEFHLKEFHWKDF